MQLLKTATILLVALLFTTCLDEIDLGQGESLPDGIVLQGRINAGDGGEDHDVRVKLERLFIAQESNRPDQVVTATVTLENSEGQSISLPFRDGAYRASITPGDASFRVESGLGFRVRVMTRENEEYETDFDVLQQPLDVEAARAVIGTVEVENNVGVTVELPAMLYDITAPVEYPDGTPTFLRWTLERTYKVTDQPVIAPFNLNDPKPCYVTRAFDGSNLILFNSLESSLDRVENFPLTSQVIDFEYSEGYVMTIFQEALSREAFEYFDQIDRISSRESSLFEPPGGPVVGNARDVNGLTTNVFGFFYASSRSSARVAVSPEQAGNPGFFCPLVPSTSPFPPPNDCDDCQFISGSDLMKPVWFPF